jgi:hypothetical protein
MKLIASFAAALFTLASTSAVAGKGPVANQALGSGNSIVSSSERASTQLGTSALPIFVAAPQYARLLALPGAVHNPQAGTVTIRVTLKDGSSRDLVFSQQGGQAVGRR